MYLSSSYDSKKSDSTDDSNHTTTTTTTTTSSSGLLHHSSSGFAFPPAPRLCKSANNTSCSVSCQSDSSASDGRIIKSKRRNRKRHQQYHQHQQSKTLPPIGVFWDIENCQVPKNKSAAIIVQRIREFFFDGYREAEFIVVCDVKKENPQVIQDLHDAQVNLIHVLSTSKNAADEKLRQSLRRFAETHPAPATVVLISGDVNFAADLSDLRYRKKLHVILVHNANVADALILCANETYTYASITDNLPVLKRKTNEFVNVYVSNLPTTVEKKQIRNRLKFLSDNCGGRVVNIDNVSGTAMLRFSSMDFAIRAQRRLNGEDVYGRKVVVSNSGDWRSHNSPRTAGTSSEHLGRRRCSTMDVNASFAGRKITKSNDGYQGSYNVPQATYQENAFYSMTCRETWRMYPDKSQQGPMVLQEPNTFRNSRSCPPHHEPAWSSGRHASFSRPKTPQDEVVNPLSKLQKSGSCDYGDHSKLSYSANTFQPIPGQNPQQQQQQHQSSSVELMITNLDPSVKDLRNVLVNLLKEHAMIYSLNITSQQDGTPVACVRVSCPQDAHNVISQFHHYKLGFKRLSISHVQSNTLDPAQLKEMVIMLLQEAPLKCMPLYRLLNLLEARFLTNVSVSEVNKLKDVCRISDDNGERIISLTPEVRLSPPSGLQRASVLYCSVHCPNGLNRMDDLGFEGGDDEMQEIPHIRMELKVFAAKLNELLNSHLGTLPLLSFAICYKYEFGEILPTDPFGVPLEHLVTCVSNVKLKFDGLNKNTKYIVRDMSLKGDSDRDDNFMKNLSPSITSNINLLSRELVDLLKTTERCQLQLNKYIPAYHHHFGRQLRVADYGYTKLTDLLYSPPISNIVQILGEGAKRTITLTHPTQMRRFTSDLLRILKSQVSKQLTADDFPAAYEKVLNRPFNIVEYGLCTLQDLLDEVPENTVVISRTDQGISIAIPKREQTSEEVIRTKQFAEEVVKLLSYSPQCSMLFNKFVPAYHHHFGHQCKVSDYGFTKLIELFEAIPDTVKVEEMPDGERKVCLTLHKALNLRGNQIADLVRKSHLYLPLESLSSAFQREYGFPLKPQYYNCKDIKELVSKLGDYVKITQSNVGSLLAPVESDTQSTLALRVWALLISPPHHYNLPAFVNLYNARYQSNITISTLEQLNNVIINRSSNAESIFLTPPFSTAAKIYLLLYKEGGQVPYNALDSIYRRNYGVSLLQNEEDTYEKLLSEFSFLIVMRRTKKRTNIALNPKIIEYGLYLPSSSKKNENPCVRMDEPVSWPPPPLHDIVLDGSSRGITPPKPDTPPAPGSAPWKLWDTPTKYNTMQDFSIPLPAVQTPKMLVSTESLMSPTRNLLSAAVHPLCSGMTNVSPPNPNELPMPDKLLKKGAISDDSTDSGVNNSHITSENEMDISSNEHGGKIASIRGCFASS